MFVDVRQTSIYRFVSYHVLIENGNLHSNRVNQRPIDVLGQQVLDPRIVDYGQQGASGGQHRPPGSESFGALRHFMPPSVWSKRS